MKLEREGCTPIIDVTPKKVASELRKLKSYGPSSFATLSDDHGDFVQVAGSGQGCVVEKKARGALFRAHSTRPSFQVEDGVLLSYTGGQMLLRHDEWLDIDRVIAIFSCFAEGRDDSSIVSWRPHDPDAAP